MKPPLVMQLDMQTEQIFACPRAIHYAVTIWLAGNVSISALALLKSERRFPEYRSFGGASTCVSWQHSRSGSAAGSQLFKVAASSVERKGRNGSMDVAAYGCKTASGNPLQCYAAKKGDAGRPARQNSHVRQVLIELYVTSAALQCYTRIRINA